MPYTDTVLDDLQPNSSAEISAALKKILNKVVAVVPTFIIIWVLVILFDVIGLLQHFNYFRGIQLILHVLKIGFPVWLIALLIDLYIYLKKFIAESTQKNYRKVKTQLINFIKWTAIVIIAKVLYTFWLS